MTTPIRFLLVDDDMDDIFLFREVMQEIDPQVSVTSAGNGLEALQNLRSGDGSLPDIIFLDLNMPRMDGRECLTELKNDASLRHIPVIIYTTSSHSLDMAQARQNGALGFITKPSSLKELQQFLSAVTSHARGDLAKALVSFSVTS
ncbi:response regulator [Chitinophaga lutea]